jgi:DNA-directed RNA polymerase specialized sigma24 family protein
MLFPPKPDPLATRATLLLHLRPDSLGRELTWHEFYETYGSIIGGFSRRMGIAGRRIPDVVHDVLLGFFGVSPNFVYNPSRGRSRAYLKTCTWRTIQQRLFGRLQLAGGNIEDVADDEPNVEDKWNDLWESEKLRRAVEVVRGKYASRPHSSKIFLAFEMYALLDRSVDLIASELGMSINSVRQAKSRVSKAVTER